MGSLSGQLQFDRSPERCKGFTGYQPLSETASALDLILGGDSGNGELNRLIADALRRAEKPLASSDIADAIVEAKGYGRESIHALTRRVRANLSYLLRHRRVVKTGDRLTARWSLPGAN
jgi:hypothetical protein